MKIDVDIELLKISVPLFVIGFGLIWWQTGFWCALGVMLLCAASGVRRTI